MRGRSRDISDAQNAFFVFLSMGEIPHAFRTTALPSLTTSGICPPTLHKALIYHKIIILSTSSLSSQTINFYCILFKLEGPDEVTGQTLPSKYPSPTEHFVSSLHWRREEQK